MSNEDVFFAITILVCVTNSNMYSLHNEKGFAVTWLLIAGIMFALSVARTLAIV